MVLIKSPKECEKRKISWGVALGVAIFLGTSMISFSSSRSSSGSSYPSSSTRNIIKQDKERYRKKHERNERYQCRGWYTTRGLAPFAVFRVVRYLKSALLGLPGIGCYDDIPGDESGYCSILDTKTGLVHQTYTQYYYNKASFRPEEQLQEPFLHCSMAAGFLNMRNNAIAWEQNQPIIHQQHPDATADTDSETTPQQRRRRGIIMKIDRDSLPGVYANLQLLRIDYKCTLPIELWTNGGEDGIEDSIFDHPMLKMILQDPSIRMKFHWDWRYEGDNNLLYGAAHTTFDEVLLLDHGSFPLRDPTYLFDDPQYKERGALFWKSLWSNSGTGRKANKRKSILTALAHQEQQGHKFSSHPNLEAGHMLIDRQRCSKQLRLLLFIVDTLKKYGLPTNAGLQDMVPIVWEMTETQLGIVENVPDILGVPRSIGASFAAGEFLTPLNYISQRATSYYKLCGLSTLYLDTQGEPLFVDRPNAPLSNPETMDYKVWDRAVTIIANHPNAQFEQEKFPLDYDVSTGQDFVAVVDDDQVEYRDYTGLVCSFPKLEAKESFKERPLVGTNIARLEEIIIRYAREVHAIEEHLASS